ncbi:hypothetical protein bcere0014_22300 [Bacillus cereus BDRD-ST196]|nr:hypothetical protein bcere0014_22300 [Bacillus cereus BDRD-ST196]
MFLNRICSTSNIITKARNATKAMQALILVVGNSGFEPDIVIETELKT